MTEQQSACCPPGSWGPLKADTDYKDKGVVERVADDIDIYRVGSSDKCIVWNYDIFGFQGGRTRQLCDMVAEQGYMVILPDWYRGKMQGLDEGMEKVFTFIKEQTNWDALKRDWLEKIKPYAQRHGAKTYGTIGTCWGSYPVLRLCALPEFKVGVSMHPSHPNMLAETCLNEDQRAALEACKGTPQVFMPAGNDSPDVKPGGIGQQVLGDDVSIVEFPDVTHGWTTRGDLTDEKVEAEVKRALVEAVKAFNLYLK